MVASMDRSTARPDYRSFTLGGNLDRVTSPFSRTDADDVLDRENEDLPVADAARLGGTLDGVHDLRNLLVADDDVELYLGEKINHVLRAAVELRVPLLAAEPFHFADGDALDADRAERFFDLVELEGLDARLDLLHGTLLVERCGEYAASGRSSVGTAYFKAEEFVKVCFMRRTWERAAPTTARKATGVPVLRLLTMKDFSVGR